MNATFPLAFQAAFYNQHEVFDDLSNAGRLFYLKYARHWQTGSNPFSGIARDGAGVMCQENTPLLGRPLQNNWVICLIDLRFLDADNVNVRIKPQETTNNLR